MSRTHGGSDDRLADYTPARDGSTEPGKCDQYGRAQAHERDGTDPYNPDSSHTHGRARARGGERGRAGDPAEQTDRAKGRRKGRRIPHARAHESHGQFSVADNARTRGGGGTWGGARNSKGKESWFLSAANVAALTAAADFTQAIGCPFNRHWTVHYERAGIDDRDGRDFIGRLLKQAGTAVRRAGGRVTATWVRENGDGKGAHVHILMHLPAGFTLRGGRTRRWIVGAGGTWHCDVSDVETIGRSLKAATSSPLDYAANLGRVRAYQLKAADADAKAREHLERAGEGGRIIGKRCGWTENIGAAARQKRRVC